ncbi:MAG TPA: cupin domain-containing protein [Thermoplasmata archaeon]|nr:cupin domain-containing protein [Thermoplasmata archaeon]
MGIVERPKYEPLLDDPDDYRPRSKIAIFFDPGGPRGEPVQNLCLIFEECAPGDRIPLHIHPHDEVVVIDEGMAEYVLGDERRRITGGAVVFVPRGTIHGLRNPGPDMLRLHGILPSTIIGITYRERNPRPGTEGQPPQPPLSVDVRRIPGA